jgi:alpha/beta superfamily hydrolase
MKPLKPVDFTAEITPLELSGPAGRLECVVGRPEISPKKVVGIVCHPHPLHGGTMNNKVVTTVCRSFQKLGVWSVRFNYRGVGQSEGSYGDVAGECQDLMAVIDQVKQLFADHTILLAGFSFGAFVAAFAATKIHPARLISIAPSVVNMDYSTLPTMPCPWLVIQGEQDEIVSPEAVYQWAAQVKPPVELIRISGVGHFFHGKLINLREVLMGALESDLSQ